MSRVVFIQHEDDCPPARVGEWLVGAGATLEVVRPYLGDDLPDPLDADGLVVLGGSMGAHDDAAYPWLAATKRLLVRAVEAGVPTWGICLGHQLIAAALGGRVEPCHDGRTVGVFEVGFTPVAEADILFGHSAATGGRAVHWNRDAVTVVPESAQVLATLPAGQPQVIRFGERAWGVQFHPEVDGDIVRRWVKEDDLPAEVAETAIASIEAADAELVATWRSLAERFAALL